MKVILKKPINVNKVNIMGKTIPIELSGFSYLSLIIPIINIGIFKAIVKA